MIRMFLTIVAVTSLLGPSAAQEPAKVAPPVNPGDAIPGPFRSYVVTDERTDAKNPSNRTGKQHCLVCESDLNPTVAVFLRTIPADPNSGAAKLLKRLDGLVTDHKELRFGSFAIFLTLAADFPQDEARDEKAKGVKDFAAQLKVPNVPFGVAAGKSDATDSYAIPVDQDVTVILYNRAKVVKRWSFTADKPPGDADIDAVVTAIKDLAK